MISSLIGDKEYLGYKLEWKLEKYPEEGNGYPKNCTAGSLK